MDALFSDILRFSLQGGVVILAVMVLRLLLKKAPKRSICLLWLLAGARLLLPFEIQSPVSLQPDYESVTRQEWVQPGDDISVPDYDYAQSRGEILGQQGEVLVTKPVTHNDYAQSRGEILGQQGEVLVTKPVTHNDYAQSRGEILNEQGEVLVSKPVSPNVQIPQTSAVDMIPYIWLAGVAVMGLYTIVSYRHLKRKVADAVILEEGVWVTRGIDTPFLLGFVHPQIYLPVGLAEWERPFVLAHERVHLSRKDHWWKLIGFIALAVHWFNPLVWAGYWLLCRDLEMACDEAVVKTMDLSSRKAYSAALVNCSANHRLFAACPVAFGEVSVKERVKHVLRFKKPGFWITVLAVIAAVFVAVFFLTSPGEQEEEVLRAGYTGPSEDYEYYNTGEREVAWEEDVLYMAEKLLTEHPYVTDDDFFIYSGLELQEVEFSNALYDPELREDVIDHVDRLIPKLGEMTDGQIILELQRIMALLNDPMTELYLYSDARESIPVALEAIYEQGQVSLYAFRVPKANEALLYGKLSAINGVPIEEVLAKLRPYVSSENDDWSLMRITSPYIESLIYQKYVLQAIGIVDMDEDTVELTFETEQGKETAVLPFLTGDEYKAMEKTAYQLRVNTEKVQYRGLNDEWYWYDVLEDGKVLYMHIYNIAGNIDLGHDFEKFLVEATTPLQNAEEPMRVVIDFRFAGSGHEFQDGVNSFIGRINRYSNDGVYILVDSTTNSTGTLMAYRMAQGIEGAKIVGTPTGTGVNYLCGASKDSLPNSGIYFWVENICLMPYPEAGNTLNPDIPVYQTLEDYKNGVDTVFEAAVSGELSSVSLGTATMPEEEAADAKTPFINMEDAIDMTEWGKYATVRMNGANRVLIQECIEALEQLRSRESVHLTATATFEGIPGETGSYQEYWQSGDRWMRVGQQLFEDPLENYTVGNLCLTDTQYRFGHAGTYPVEDRTWTLAEEEQLWHPYWLMDFDLSEARILSLEKWDTEEGIAVKMELGRKTDTGVYGTQYRRTHTYYLDMQGNLLRLVEEAVDDPITVNDTKVEKRLSVDIQIMGTPEEEIAAKLDDAQKETLK